MMRKEGDLLSGNISGNITGKLIFLVESKPLIPTLVAFSLVMVVWNLQLYHSNLINSASCHHCSTTTTTTTLHLQNTTTTTAAPPSRKSKPYTKPQPADPNKLGFKNHGNAAALFVQMGAYRGGINTFAIVGLASKPVHVYGDPWFDCDWVPNKPGSDPIAASKTYHVLPDWGYGRVYTTLVVNCTFSGNPNSDNSGGKLMVHAYYSASHDRFERFEALKETPGSYNRSKFEPPFQYDYLYCGSPLYGTISPARVREWVAYHAWFFGPRSHFVFYDAGGVTAGVRAALDPWIRAGWVTMHDVKEQEKYDSYYYNQFAVVNDCLHRYRYAAKWSFFFDLDEYMYLPDGSSLESVLDDFSNYTQFTIQQNPMSSDLCFNNSKHDYSGQWAFEKLIFRDSISQPWKDRKYAIQARLAFATGIHLSYNIEGETLHKTEDKIRYYHYHNTIQIQGEVCKVFLPPSSKWKVITHHKVPYVYDDRMLRLADTIKSFERDTIGNLTTNP